MAKRYIVVEGHGELEAAPNLINRLWKENGDGRPWISPARRFHRLNPQPGWRAAAERYRSESGVSGLLLLRDEDDGCPRELGPQIAADLQSLKLPFAVAIVLLKPEWEVLFLPCIAKMAGLPLDKVGALERPGLAANARWTGDWESRRGVKEWLTQNYPPGKSYKPTTDQLALTRKIDLDLLRKANVPCFGTLENALRFFITAGPGEVYPPPVPR